MSSPLIFPLTTPRAYLFVSVAGTAVGLQILRALLPLIVYVYGAQPSVTSLDMGVLAIGIFLTAFLAGAPLQWLGPVRALAVSAAALAVARVSAQVVTPSAALWIAAGGTVAFLWFIPSLFVVSRRNGAEGPAHVGAGLIAGLALDVAISGAFSTWDPLWQRTPAAIVLGVLLVLVFGVLVRRLTGQTPGSARAEVQVTAGGALAALGPLLFLQLLLFQNTARVAALTGWRLPTALFWVLAADAVAIWIATTARSPRLIVLAAAALIPASVVALDPGLNAPIALAVGSVASAILTVAVAAAPAAPGGWRASLSWGAGVFVFAAFAFVYYVGYDMRLPFENRILPPIAAAVAALIAIMTTRTLPRVPDLRAGLGRPVRALLIVPVLLWAFSRPPQAAPASGWPVRVMSYNLHQGFATSGAQDLEALARTIEDAGADVTALQEVSRGWVINGSTEMLSWLARRLRMHVVWGPAADAVWGNAIISRRPIILSGGATLPRGGVPMRRGVLWAEVEMFGRDRLLVIATHFHHVEAHGHVRVVQAQALVEAWKKRDQTVVIGDLNATPEAPEIDILRAAGLKDAFMLAGQGSGFTFSAANPERRIDYIWISPDLVARDFRVMPGQASDHLGIAVTVERPPR